MPTDASPETDPTATGTRRVVRRRGTSTGTPVAAPAGAGLLDEAEQLVAAGRTKRALEVFDVARGVIDDHDRHLAVTSRMLVVAADGGHRRAAARLAAELHDRDDHLLDADAHVALAIHESWVGRFDRADTLAREAIHRGHDGPEPWSALATSYAGLGWFDEAAECRTAAERRGDPGEPEFRRLGRAINDWSLQNNHATLLAVIGVILFNVIGLAIALTVPFLVRAARIERLADEMALAARFDWQGRHGLRLARGAAVLLLVLTWVVLASAAGPAAGT